MVGTTFGCNAIINHFESMNKSVDSKRPLSAEIAKPQFDEWTDKPEYGLRIENAKPKDSMSSKMKKIEDLCARLDKVEVDLMDTKMSIRELALGFKDQELVMKGLLFLQRNENIKK